MDEFKEYVTFTVTSQAGEEVEMAVVDQFEIKNRKYIAAALIQDDEIDENNVYIYKVEVTEDDFKPIKITNQIEYNEVAEAYLDMCAEEAGVDQE